MAYNIRIDPLDERTFALCAPPHPLLDDLIGPLADPARSRRDGEWILTRDAEPQAREALRDLFGSNGHPLEPVIAVVVRFSRGITVPGLPYLFGRRLLELDGEKLIDSEGTALLDGEPSGVGGRRWQTFLPAGTAFYIFDLPARAPELANENPTLRPTGDFAPIPPAAYDLISRSAESRPSLPGRPQRHGDNVLWLHPPMSEPTGRSLDEEAGRLVEVARRLDLSPEAYMAAVHAAARKYQSEYWFARRRPH